MQTIYVTNIKSVEPLHINFTEAKVTSKNKWQEELTKEYKNISHFFLCLFFDVTVGFPVWIMNMLQFCQAKNKISLHHRIYIGV
jgi:hypothetical protein